LEEEFRDRKEIEKRLEDELEEKLKDCHILKDECEEKSVRIGFIEDELATVFKKIKKLNKWVKTMENKCDAMHINSSGRDESNESMC